MYKKVERSPLDRFKNRNRLLKTFGEAGPSVYDMLTGALRAAEVRASTGIDKAQFALIMDFIVSNSMAEDMGTPMKKSSSEDMQEGRIPPEDESFGDSESGAEIPPESEGSSGIPPDSENDDSGEAEEKIRPGHSPPGIDSGSGTSDSLSPLEKMIWDKYGDSGVKVYNLIDGEKTAEEILTETGISETKLVEILEFMNEQGIIKLEKPPESKRTPSRPPMGQMGAAPVSPQGQPAQPQSSSADVGFKPMLESQPHIDGRIGSGRQPAKFTPPAGSETVENNPDAVPIDVPVMLPLGFMQKLSLAAAMVKFGSAGNDLLKRVDGAKDFIDISIETRQPLSNLDVVFGELGKKNLMTFKQLTRQEIQHRYGDDGLAVFKRYGRDGVLIYQLIGKESSLRDIVTVSRVDPDKAAEIILFVHKVLGLDMPIDRDMIYRYLQK